MKIQSILGPIDTAALGPTLMHEHISCADWSMRMNFGDKFFEADTVVDMAKKAFAPVQAMGIKTIVDGTPFNLGRDLSLIRATAEATGLNIIASCGFYFQEEPWLQERSAEEIYDLMYADAAQCGIMKCAVERQGVTPLMEKLLAVTGQVAAERDMPIFCHTASPFGVGPDAFDRLGKYVPAHRIILGHTGDTNDRGYLKAVAETGCYLGFDRLGHCDRDNSVEAVADNILWLCSLGYRDRILLSHDAAVYLAFWDSWEKSREQVTDFTVVHTQALPLLRAGGMTEADIGEILEGNPRRFFEGQP
ncbi:MAG: phosphotriesterase [Oscillospiraceae bacterium]|nr:phosphotriesterase [Oscillospiraceae bacterium]